MPYCELSGMQLHHETFGAARSDWPPLLLIHGATSTGAAPTPSTPTASPK